MTIYDFTAPVGWNETFELVDGTTDLKNRSAVRVKDLEGWIASIHEHLLRAERDLLLLTKEKERFPETEKQDIREHCEGLAGAIQDSTRSLESKERRIWWPVKYNWKYC